MMADVYIVMTADPENTKALLTTQFDDFGKGPKFHKEWEPFLGDGIFATDGKYPCPKSLAFRHDPSSGAPQTPWRRCLRSFGNFLFLLLAWIPDLPTRKCG